MSEELLIRKLQNVQALINECFELLGQPGARPELSPISSRAAPTTKENIVVDIANMVAECEEQESIKKMVLDKGGQEGKVLLCFYISHKYFGNAWLTSGQVGKITSELGIKIDVSNVSRFLKDNRQYFESGAVRKNGQPTPYRLNRTGLSQFGKILNGKAE